MAVTGDAGGAMDTRILAEQLRFFCHQTQQSVVGHGFVAIAATALLLTQPVDRRWLFAWAVAAVVLALVRVLVYRRFPAAIEDRSRALAWGRRFRLLSGLSGGMFGCLAVLFIEPGSFETTAWILLVLCGVSGAAMGAYATYSPAYGVYLAAALGPLVVVLLTLARLDMTVVAVLAAGFGIYLHVFSRRLEAAILDQIESRLENSDLASRLARQGEVLRSVVESIPNAIAVVDPEGRLHDHNERFRTLFELPGDLLRQTPLTSRAFNAFRQERGDFEHLPAAELQQQQERWKRLEGSGAPFGYERVLRDGRVLRVENNPMPGGGWVRSWIDISEARRIEAETARQSELLRLVLDSIDQGVVMRDRQDNILVYNDRLAEILNVPVSLYARNAGSAELEDIHRGQQVEQPPEVREWLARRLAGEPVQRLEYQRRSPDGGWVHVVFQPLPEGREMRTFTDITAMKAAEEELTEKTRFLETVLAAMEQGVLVTDRDGRISLWNDRACEILGIPAAVLAARPTAEELGRAQRARGDLDPADGAVADYVAHWQAWLEAPAVREIFTHERLLPGGRWMLVYGRKLPDGGTVRTFTDITARKGDEAALLEAKEEAEQARESLRAAMDAMPAGIVIHDAEMNYQTWNEAYKQLANLSEAELRQLRSFDRVAEAKRSEIQASQTMPYAAYIARRRELLASRRPGVTTEYWASAGRHIELRVNPIPDGGWVSVYLDMTSRIEAEREIAEKARAVEAARDAAEATRERMRAILQTIPVGVLVYDPRQRIEFWNDAYLAICGFPVEVLEKKPSFEDYSRYIFQAHERGRDMSLEQFMAYRHRVYGSDAKYQAEFRFDMTGLDVQYSVASLPDGGRVNVIVDITDQKQAERTALEARDAAEEATRAKSAFLAAMSHEIRTPMNGVIGMAEVLQQSGLSEDQRAIAGTIRESGQVLLRIIDDILDFSKIEAERMELESETVDIRAVSESVLDTVSPLADTRDLDLALQIHPTAPEVVIGDPVRLRQILLNLVSNAVKFTEAGAVVVRASAAPDPGFPSGVRLRFEIADTGIGIDETHIPQLFQPFRQAEASTTRRFGGTGLGLSICQRLVRLMGGEIGVRSRPGEGATFWFEIPAEPSVLAAEPEEPPVDLTGLTVLLLHRPGPLGDQVAAMLQAAGMTVTRTEDGAGAGKHVAGGGGFDIVMADGRLGVAALAALQPPVSVDADEPHLRALWVRNGREVRMQPIPVTHPFRRHAVLRAAGAAVGRISPETPSVADPVAALPARTPPTKAVAAAAGRLILVVEDNATNRMVVERQLGILGYAVETATDGREAMALWRPGRFGLVLTDCHMPNMDGYQLAGAIRATEVEGGGHVPIVALTANALVGEAERCIAAGMDDYLAKPVTLSVMSAMLSRWLGGAEAAPASAAGAPQSVRPEDGEVPIDMAQMVEILGTADPETVGMLLSMFRDSLRSLQPRMTAAIDGRDAGALREAAHAAKGAAANACATALQAALADLEAAAAEKDWDAVAAAWQAVGRRAERVEAHIAANGLSS